MSRHAVFLIHADPSVRGLYTRELAPLGDCDFMVVNCGGYSSAYSAEAKRLVDSNGRALPKFLAKHSANSSRTPESISIVSFSAGYGLARGLLSHPDDRRAVDAYVAIDSIHAGFSAPGKPELTHLAPFVEYARLAQQGGCLFWLGHSDVKTPQKGPGAFASTTQVAQELVKLTCGQSGNWFVRSYNTHTDDHSEHVDALTGWGPHFVAEALVPFLGSGWRGTSEPAEEPKTGKEVPRVVTPVGTLELAAILRDGHTSALGFPPSTTRLGVGWAQVMLETGRGKQVNNNNLGNVTAGKSWSGDWFSMKVPPPDPPVLKFRSYPHWLDSSADYWRLLSRRFSTALPMFDSGEPIRAAAELSRLKYFLAPLAGYAKAMDGLYKEFWSKILPQL